MNELRTTYRALLRVPGSSTLAVLLLALGIGSCTAFLTVFQAQVAAPFPYPEPERVVQLWRTHGAARASDPWSFDDFVDVRAQATTLESSGLYQPERFNLGGDSPRSLQGARCMAGVFQALGVTPLLGRGFTAADDQPGHDGVVLLSYATWLEQFGGDPQIIGRSLRLNAQPRTIIGVMPAGFEFHCPWTGARAIELWTPLPATPTGRGNYSYLAVGRLRPGVSADAANAELRAISGRLAATYPDTNFGKSFHARPLADEIATHALTRYSLVLAAIALVLLTACANVALLMLARGAARQTEFAVRLALGATRWQLARLALGESLLLATLGGALGVMVAWHLTLLLARLFPALSTHAVAIQLNGPVLAGALLLTFAAAIAAGVPPALAAIRTQVGDTLKQGGLSQTTTRLRHRWLRHLVAVQVAVSLLLVNTALLLLTSFRSAVSVNQPLASDHVLVAGVTINAPHAQSVPERQALWERIVARMQALPGVTAAGMTTKLPLRGGSNFTILAEEQAFDPKIARPTVEFSNVLPGYYRAMGLPLLQGRLPAPWTGQNIEVVVNRTLATSLWPGRDPLGRQIRGNAASPWFTATVVGVVGDVRQWEMTRPALGEVYFPYGYGTLNVEYLVVRSGYDASQLVPLLRHELAAIDSDLALIQPQTMDEVVSDITRDFRQLLAMVAFFMGASVLIAGAGIHGALVFQTRQRTREIGVRLALGADPRRIIWLVLRQSSPLVLGGGTAGMLLSFLVALGLRAAFQDLRLLNPLYLAGGPLLLAVVTMLACWLPARRATRVDPTEALRAE